MLLSVYDQSVAGVVSPLKPDDEIRLFSKQIDNLAFSFIAPLSAHYDYIRHIFVFLSSHIVRPITRSKRKGTVRTFPSKKSRDDWPVGIYEAGFFLLPVTKIHAGVKKKSIVMEEFSPLAVQLSHHRS